MYSHELMKFLLDYDKREEKSSKKIYNFKDGNRTFGFKKLANIPVTIKNQ